MQQIHHQSLDNLEERFPLLSQRDAPAEEVCTADEVKAAKRRKLSEEAQEADDLRKRLEIVQDKDDDVFVKATLLAQKDINQIDEDDIEEMDIKWNMALLSMRADRFWKKTGKKITIQGTDVAGFDKSKVECFNCHKMGYFARECRAPRSQDSSRREIYKQGSKVEESAPKALMDIDGVGWDWSYMANEEENHALVADDEPPTEFALMAKSSSSSENEVFDDSLCSKSCKKNTDSLNTKITKLNEALSDSKTNLYHYKLGISQVKARLVEFKTQEIKFCEKIRGLKFDVKNKNIEIENLMNELEQIKKEKEVLFPSPPPAQVYSPPKKDMSWTGLLKFADDTITDYSRPSLGIESNSSDLQNSNSSVSKHGESSESIMSKPMSKFVKAADSPIVIKTNKVETVRKPSVKYAEIYRNTSKSPKVKGNQRNWNNLKTQQLGKDFVMKNKACSKCGQFDHLAYDCGVWVNKGKTWPKNNYAHKSMSPRNVFHKTGRTSIRVNRPNMNVAQPKRTSYAKPAHSYSNSQNNIDDKGYWDSGCSRHMTGNISYLSDYEPYDEGYVLFGQGGGKITGKGKINLMAMQKAENHNVDFHQIVDFVEASHIRYALPINPTVYVSHIRQCWSTPRIETTNEGTKILATVDGRPRTISESSIRRNLKLNDEEGISQFSHQWKFLIHTIMQCLNPKSTGFNEFSSNIATAVGEGSGTLTEPHHTPSPEAQQLPHHDLSSSLHPTKTISTETPTEIPTLRQYSRRATWIAQSKALPTATDKPASLLRDDSQGEAFPKLTDLCTRLQRQQTEMATKIAAQDLEISTLKARIQLLEDKDKGTVELSGDDAPIKGRSLETEEEAGVERSTERGSNDTEELVNVLTSMDAVNTSGVADVSVPFAVEVLTVSVPTASGPVPTVSAIFTTASVVTPYSRRKGKEKIVEKELKMLIDGLDMRNELIAKHFHEYEKFEAELTIGEKIELINELVKSQEHHAKILEYQAQQSKPLSKKEQRKFYMSVFRSHAGWKTKYFRGMTLDEIREKFIPVWKQIKDFVPMSSKEEVERFKRKGLRLEQGSAKKMKTSEEVSKEDLKEMMQLVHVEEVYVEALQVKHPIIDWEIHTGGKRDYWKIIRLGGHTAVYQFFVDMLKQLDREDLNQLWILVKGTLSIRQASSDKEKELWVELKRLFEPDFEDQLDQEICMLVERDYPLRKGLAIVMICNKLQRDAPAEEVRTAGEVKD
nr:hypothetical protein [Tanacetum cinerariifolium]